MLGLSDGDIDADGDTEGLILGDNDGDSEEKYLEKVTGLYLGLVKVKLMVRKM